MNHEDKHTFMDVCHANNWKGAFLPPIPGESAKATITFADGGQLVGTGIDENAAAGKVLKALVAIGGPDACDV